MIYLFLLLFFPFHFIFAQTIDVRWSDQFEKEISVSCTQEEFCYQLCGESTCFQKEGFCYNCIGSGPWMLHFWEELGKSIHQDGPLDRQLQLDLMRAGNFVIFAPLDVYNIIDSSQSLSVYRKFEALCPGESYRQLVFLVVDPILRRIQGPWSVYCEYEKEVIFFRLRKI
jgi:hypothetical protein